ncbi:MAG: YqgE/AlgH family protein [Gammaproteobacteria bacterium]|nr:YqgE/AlgH family protein [Gammaproteobacteria bacterium]
MNLSHHFLLSVPVVIEGYFEQSVVYLCEHDEAGAMGFIINHALDIKLGDVFKQMSVIPGSLKNVHRNVIRGGPVDPQVGFVIHSPVEKNWGSTLDTGHGVSVSTSPEALIAIAKDKAPEKFFVAVGYAGWGAGQLEHELEQNAWLHCPADTEILFDLPLDERFKAVSDCLGIDVNLIVGNTGHA